MAIISKLRIPLQVVEGRLILAAVIECKKLRIPRHIIEFVIDTGSPNSYFSDKDTRRLQIPVSDKASSGEVDFGGSSYKQIILPKIAFHLLAEDKTTMELDVSIYALKTTKSSIKKLQVAQALPSILGMEFLKEQKLSLHVILTENLAFLQYES